LQPVGFWAGGFVHLTCDRVGSGVDEPGVLIFPRMSKLSEKAACVLQGSFLNAVLPAKPAS
jgi:hypothetical protein